MAVHFVVSSLFKLSHNFALGGCGLYAWLLWISWVPSAIHSKSSDVRYTYVGQEVYVKRVISIRVVKYTFVNMDKTHVY